ncbi:hypothetical protein F444_16294 [Phytophthora nicotianae P1976]|uniref:Uncharacterized protein n=1 Tax=Phytophthora nicotianae P1976 TaxID=1317066 RepID=A0A080ZIZ8_PHYNI|nr:hypothetical protein F444_16294 [Phytophthora nicotianae P1976]
MLLTSEFYNQRILTVENTRVELIMHGLHEVQYRGRRVRVLHHSVLLGLKHILQQRCHFELQLRCFKRSHQIEPRGGTQHVACSHEEVHALCGLSLHTKQSTDNAKEYSMVDTSMFSLLCFFPYRQ